MNTSPVRLKDLIPFKSSRILNACVDAWTTFFELCLAEPTGGRIDIALWETQCESATIKLRGGRSAVDETDPEVEPNPGISFLIGGLVEKLNEIDNHAESIEAADRRANQVRREFLTWVQNGIDDSFQSSKVQKLYGSYNPANEGFTICSTLHDEGLAHSEMMLLWRNRNGLTVPEIRAAARALSQRSKHKRVRKVAKYRKRDAHKGPRKKK